MKLYEIAAFGIENLRRSEITPTEPRANEVMIRVRAVSLNYRDLLMVRGHYHPNLQFPRIPVSDGAGEIVAIGEDVTSWKVGDRVVVPFFPDWLDGAMTPAKTAGALGGNADGMLREFITIRADAPVPIPDHLSFEQAATLPCSAVTAWNSLFVAGTLKPGETVLIQGTGGVSLFGLQFAKLAGAEIILISSSDEKLERGHAMGAHHLINYRHQPDWEKNVLALTQRRGVDVTIEVGGSGTLARTMRATANSGRISLVGILAGAGGDVSILPILHKAITVNGIYVGSRAMFETMNVALARHRLEPVIDRIFSFDEAPDAFRHLEGAGHFGKVVIRVD